MKLTVCIPTYNRPELLPIAVESILKDPTNPGLPIFVSSDSDPKYRTKELKRLKTLCNRGPSKIYYVDTERSEAYKTELQEKSGVSKEVVNIAINGGSAGANRNRLLLLACTYCADGVIFSDDDMKVEDDFIEYHDMALGNTVSQFVSKLKNFKRIPTSLSEELKQTGLEKTIEVFAAGWVFYDHVDDISYDVYFRKSENLFESIELNTANLSLTNLVYSTIPFPINIEMEDYIFGKHVKKMLESMNGIVLKGSRSTSIHGDSTHTSSEKKFKEIRYLKRRGLSIVSTDVMENLPTSHGKNFGKKMVKIIGQKIQNYGRSSEFQEELLEGKRIYRDRFNPKDIVDELKGILHKNGILYQNWSDLTDAAKKIDSSVLEEFLVTK